MHVYTTVFSKLGPSEVLHTFKSTGLYWSGSLLTAPSTSLCNAVCGGLLQDTFVAKVQRSVAKTNKLTRTKKRAWHTEESMMKKLDWSKPL